MNKQNWIYYMVDDNTITCKFKYFGSLKGMKKEAHEIAGNTLVAGNKYIAYKGENDIEFKSFNYKN